jgi:hypothetical protein
MGSRVTTDRTALLRRRDFLVRSGLLLGASSVTGTAGFLAAKELADTGESAPARPHAAAVRTWDDVRALFDLAPNLSDLTTFMLSPHPLPVREAIARHRRGLDASPKEYLYAREREQEERVAAAAAEYLGTSPTDIAFTDSTTMGLGLFYGGFRLRHGDEYVRLGPSIANGPEHVDAALRAVRALVSASAARGFSQDRSPRAREDRADFRLAFWWAR